MPDRATSNSAADYIVIRGAPDLPAGFLPEWWEGRWFNKAAMLEGMAEQTHGGVAVPTGRFETNSDGQVAEVYEVRV